MNGIKLPLTISLAGHATCLALLIAIMSHQAPPIPESIAGGGIEVMFTPPPPPETPPPPAATPPPPEPQAEVVPPPPEPVLVVTELPPPAPEAPTAAVEPPPPPRKPVIKKAQKPVVHRVEPVQPPMPTPAGPVPPSPSAPPQTAMAATPVPAPVPSPEVTRGYGAIVSAWLNSHKRYPDAARQRGEEGHAQLHFDVDPSGRVIDYAILKSSGYPDLDAAIEAMMRGATLPPFPAGMNQTRFPVTVTITFRLEQ